MDYDSRKANNIAEFERIQDIIRRSADLRAAIKSSIAVTKLYKEVVYHSGGGENGIVRVTDANTFDVARPLAAKGYRVAILNMASATNPGGGVANGANAQE